MLLACTRNASKRHYPPRQVRQSTVRMPKAVAKRGRAKTVEVVKTEEKGSDVNLATYLLIDALLKDSDIAVVVSNDPDLCEPIRIVNDEFGVPVGLLNPHRNVSSDLRKLRPTFLKQIRKGPYCFEAVTSQ